MADQLGKLIIISVGKKLDASLGRCVKFPSDRESQVKSGDYRWAVFGTETI